MWIVAALVGTQAFLLGWEAYRDSPTWDEVAHFTAGVNTWRNGSFRVFCVNPPLVRTAGTGLAILFGHPLLPAGPFDSPKDLSDRAEFQAGRQTADLNGANFFWQMTLARWGAIPFTLLGGVVCFLWARDLYGPAAGLLGQAVWTFEPSVLGHGHLITPDVAAASVGLTAAYLLWRWLRLSTWPLATAAGIGLGVALVTKSSMIVYVGLWPGLWAAYRLLPDRSGRRVTGWLREATQMAGILLVAIWTMNLAYGFEGSLKPLGEYGFVSKVLGGPSDPGNGFDVGGATFRNRWRDTWVGSVPVPLPESYVLGIDLQKRDLEKDGWSYLRGRWQRGGWWYYYLYAMLVKLPVGLLAMLGLSATTTALSRLRNCMCPGVPPLSGPAVRDELVLLIPAVTVLVLVSSQLAFNRHLRYVLPAFPFLFVWATRAARLPGHGPRWPRVAVWTSCALLVASSMSVYPHSLSYFNELAGGPAEGTRHLGSSNTDWGQDLLYLRDWVAAHPEAKPLYVSVEMPLVDPRTAGIDAPEVPTESALRAPGTSPTIPVIPMPGWHVVSVNRLLGPEYAYLNAFTAIDWSGHTLRIFHITEAQARHTQQDAKLMLTPAKLPLDLGVSEAISNAQKPMSPAAGTRSAPTDGPKYESSGVR